MAADLGQGYFFQKESEVVFEVEPGRVGINTEAPEYNLDVKDSIRTSNLVAKAVDCVDVSTSNVICKELSSAGIECTNMYSANLLASSAQLGGPQRGPWECYRA